ncbi:FAD-binding monooxygenase [Amorphoplanes nipponensis]|uniref:FAD-binding monooxygenase n=1 Tax=Actinoplanes nipponensis TaxID=135950 RepID=A0A919JKD6_9ACTN|nr:FAD-dependent monooxygenase [Actinoplanes nipponensis]GIE52408.1 FAD-binding monooxygenase [Actinoplanes nipponensis]
MDSSAVVIGGGIGGLAAARVLSRRYARVMVVDRDTRPADGEPRPGVPQGVHGHILLASGLRELGELFPGLDAALAEIGATRIDLGSGLCNYRFGRRRERAPVGHDITSVSRPRLEAVLRDRVAADPNVTFRDGVAVTALTGTAAAVTGVLLDTGETVAAELVVDCSGRGHRSDRWLGDLGLPAPRRLEVKIGVAYATRLYRREPGRLEGWQAAFVLPDAPREQRSGLVLPIEDDRWLVSLGGWHVGAVPTDAAGFEAYARSLPDPIVARLIAEAEPLGDPVAIRFPASRRRLFEELDRHPAGFLALGDAVCSFNPIYGQGMTVAAMAAGALGRTLDRHGGATAAAARDYYRAAAAVIAVPWRFAVGNDFAYPQTTGPRPHGVAVSNWYARRLAIATHRSPELTDVYLRVQQLLAPPSELLRPGVVARVLRLGGRS